MTRLLDITPMAQYLFTKFTSTASPSVDAQIDQFIVDLISSSATLSKGVATVRFAGTTYQFRPTDYPVMVTADGGLATDLSLFCRQLLLAMLAPTIGQRATRDPKAVAEFARSFAMKFFGGGTTGGALYDTGHWYISPHWLPIPPPNPVQEVSATAEDPVSRTLYRWAAETQDGENAKKAAKVAADPYFALLAVEGNTKIPTSAYHLYDLMNYQYSVTLIHAGGDATDVVTRAPSLVAAEFDTTTPAHWMSDAYEEFLDSSGTVLAMLQMPRCTMYNRLLERIVKEDTSYWFRGYVKDYELEIAHWENLVAVRDHIYDFKMSYLDMVRGINVGKPRLAPALLLSPLGGMAGAFEFKESVSRNAFEWFSLTESVRAWIRSDPGCPAALSWLANTPLTRISSAWLPAATDNYVSSVLLPLSK